LLKTLKAVFKTHQAIDRRAGKLRQKVMGQLEGGLPKQTIKTTLKAVNALNADLRNPLKVLAILQTQIPARLLESHYVEENPRAAGKREVILSMYLAGE
jgi:hypothetical protein